MLIHNIVIKGFWNFPPYREEMVPLPTKQARLELGDVLSVKSTVN